MNMAIRCIIFDFSGVITIENQSVIFAERLEKTTGVPKQRIYETLKKSARYTDGGEKSLQEVLEKIGITGVNESIFDVSTIIDERLLSTIRRCKVPCYLLSNNNAIVGRQIKDINNKRNLFKEVMISCDLGLIKPNRQIYHEMLKRTGLKAEECIFVDDNKENVEIAEKMGMKGFHYRKNLDEFFRYLNKLGLL